MLSELICHVLKFLIRFLQLTAGDSLDVRFLPYFIDAS